MIGLDFLLTALIVVIVPGTGVVFTVASGLALGRRLSVAAALGCTFGIVPAMLASTLGLAALLHASALMFQVVKICGVVYLLYLAWMTLQEEGPLSLKGDETQGSRHFWAVARTGFLINVLNPKLTVFFMAFLPQFIEPASGNVTGQMLLLGGVFMAMTLAVFLLYGHFAALIGTRVLRRPSVMAWLRRGLAAAFAGFGLRLALAER